MPKIKFIEAQQHEIGTTPILPGCLIATDEHRLYWDTNDGTRVEITDIIELPNEMTRESWPNPCEKFYYVKASRRLYRYNSVDGWVCLNGDPIFIGPDGKIMIGYLPGGDDIPGKPGKPGAPGFPGLPGDVVILGQSGIITDGYLPIATADVRGIALLGALGGAARYGKQEDIGLGKVTNDTQVKATDVEDVGPDERSGKLNVTSASRLYEILGGDTNELATSKKSVIGAINELFINGGQAAIPAGNDGELVTYSGEKGKFGDPRSPFDFILSPGAQLPNSKLLVAPATKGGTPGLKSITDLASSTEVIELRELITSFTASIANNYIPVVQKAAANGVATLDPLGKLTFTQLPSDIPARYVIFQNGQTFQYMLDNGMLNGPQGKQGIQGIPGIQGIQGIAGSAGTKGDRGDRGVQGDPGRDGQKGEPGSIGPQGNPTIVNGLSGASITLGAGDITTGTLPVAQLPTVPINKGGTGATTASAALAALGGLREVYHAGTAAPTDVKLLWIDTANANTMKFYSAGTWKPIRMTFA